LEGEELSTSMIMSVPDVSGLIDDMVARRCRGGLTGAVSRTLESSEGIVRIVLALTTELSGLKYSDVAIEVDMSEVSGVKILSAASTRRGILPGRPVRLAGGREGGRAGRAGSGVTDDAAKLA